MAAGSHLENGIWALLVMAATVKNMIESFVRGVCHIDVIIQCPWVRVRAIANRIITSPIRLESAVIIPAASDLGFW